MHSLTVSISLALGEPHGETHAVYQGEALRPQDLSGICDALCSLGTYTSWTIFHKCVLALVFVVAKGEVQHLSRHCLQEGIHQGLW